MVPIMGTKKGGMMKEREERALSAYPDVMTVKEIAKVLRTGVNTVYGLVHAGAIRSVRIGKRFIVPKREVLEFLDGLGYTDDADQR
jgi:excisionase family DNA binding protein